MKHVLSCGILCILSFGFVTPLAAQQQRLFERRGSEILELDTNIASLGRILRRHPLPAHSADLRTVPVAGGRYLAWVATSPRRGVAVFDTIAGTTQFIAIPNASTIAATDLTRLRLIVHAVDFFAGHRVVIIDGPELSIRTIEFASNEFFGNMTLASGPGLIIGYYSVIGTPRRSELVVIDATTAAIVRRLPIADGYIEWTLSDESGRRVVALTRGAGGLSLRLFDVIAGNFLGEREIRNADFNSSSIVRPAFDEENGRIVLGGRDGLMAISIDTLDVIGRLGEPRFHPERLPEGWTPRFEMILQCCAPGGSLFVFDWTGAFPGAFGPGVFTVFDAGLSAIDPATGEQRARASLDHIVGERSFGITSTVLVPGPRRPTLTSVVNGRNVSLSWSAPPAASHYELEVASAPGLRDGAILVLSSTTVAGELPDGIYYVRVRALNEAAKGPYSNELRIVVP